MTLEDVLQELIQNLCNDNDYTIGWGQIQFWPDGALTAFHHCGWLRATTPASMLECPGCEENCIMPVHTQPTKNGQPASAYIACDRRSDMGRIQIPLAHTQQWQATRGQLAYLLHAAIDRNEFTEAEIRQALPRLPLRRILSIVDHRLHIDAQTLINALAPPRPQTVPDITNRFVLTGDHWTVTYGGKTATFKNTLGMRYLECLIRHQGDDIHVFELSNFVNPPEHGGISQVLSGMPSSALEEIGLTVSGPNDTGESLDLKAIQEIKHHLEKLNGRIEAARETGDIETLTELEEEQAQILQQLARDTGLGGNPRKTSSPIEQTRKNVSKGIRQAIKKIEDSLPELGRHLNCVRTGTYCQYTPESKIKWCFDRI